MKQSNETPSYVPQTSKLKKWTESAFKDTGCGIQCKAIRLEELYIACDGDVIPCCHWGNAHFASKYDPNHNGHKEKHVQILKNMKIDLKKYSWDEIINEYENQKDYVELLWSNDPKSNIKQCYTQCGTEKSIKDRMTSYQIDDMINSTRGKV